MFAKLFSSITESSLWSEPKEVRLLFVTMLAKADQTGFVEASIPGLARVANLSVDETVAALECLKNPDPYSKNPENEGRRVICVPGGFILLNYEDYRSRRSQEERREYMREYMREYRSERKQPVNKVNHSKPPLSQAETEAETDTEKQTQKRRAPRCVFAKPSIEQVAEYIKDRNSSVDPVAFVAYYESNGWRVGRGPMRDWKSAVVTWEQRIKDHQPAKSRSPQPATDYEQHPEWLAILKIMREHGRDEMTDDVEWRSKNMTKAQKKAKLEAFSSWEELERANRYERKNIAKDYVLAFERLLAQGVPHK